MITVLASDFAKLWPSLQALAWAFDIDKEDPKTAQQARATLHNLINISRGAGWIDLSQQAVRLLQRAEAGQRGEIMMALTEDLKEAFQDKTSGTRLIVLDQGDTKLFENPCLDLCGKSLHVDLAISEEELNLAGRVLAVGFGTACVSHAMRSVEASLHACCKVLQVFPATVEVEDWKNLTDKISSEIKRREQQKGRSAAKTKTLKILSELMMPADGFRLAWRNHVAHAREKYEGEEARKILGHVADFLGRLSAALTFVTS